VNPWAILLILVAVAVVIVGFKGTQDNVISVIKGKPYGTSALS